MENYEQRTVVRKKDKALLAALAIFAIVVACIAIVGILLIKPDSTVTQGQADCDAVRVSGKLPGRVERLFVQPGDYVHKGDTLAKIYSSTVDAKLYQAQSMQNAAAAQTDKVDRGAREEIKKSALSLLQQAQAAETITRKTYQRMQNLFEQGVVTEQKRDEAKAAYDAATAQVAAAKSQYELALNGAQAEDKRASRSMTNAAHGSVMEVQSLLEDQYLVAPCDGEVSEIYPQEGELVAMGTPIMSISKLNEMWVTFSVREDMLNDLPMGKVINVSIPALNNKDTKLKVYYIHDMGSYAAWQATKAYGDYDSKTFEVKARPMESLENFRPGMSVILKK
ncbi:MAG: efflux RND transporter periplasmic adaptor subunit [Muribaculaceae bacterium]|nr:efflux RND transporter periplasmic adaptor subunit [Muribaculaceae bacterium]